ncbi:MAG: hypothetical protein WKF79_02265 [Nocardioides sp.]
MASSSPPRPPRRPSAGSRTPTSRPRKVAGREAPAEPVVDPGVEPVIERELDPQGPPPAEDRVDLPPHGTEEWPDEGDPPAEARGVGVTIGLVAAIVVLVLVATLESLYLWGPWQLWGPLKDDPVVSVDRPVVIGQVSHRTAVDTAAKAAVLIVSRSFETYDEQVAAATETMTSAFAEEYRTTTSQIKDRFVDARTNVTVEVTAQAVMRASDEQVTALLFLNQYVEKAGETSAYTPYRARVTMVRTESGWLVSDLETQ